MGLGRAVWALGQGVGKFGLDSENGCWGLEATEVVVGAVGLGMG